MAQLFVPAAVGIGGSVLVSILDYLKKVFLTLLSTSDAMETVLNPVSWSYPKTDLSIL